VVAARKGPRRKIDSDAIQPSSRVGDEVLPGGPRRDNRPSVRRDPLFVEADAIHVFDDVGIDFAAKRAATSAVHPAAQPEVSLVKGACSSPS
jgi:hypothetical protein